MNGYPADGDDLTALRQTMLRGYAAAPVHSLDLTDHHSMVELAALQDECLRRAWELGVAYEHAQVMKRVVAGLVLGFIGGSLTTAWLTAMYLIERWFR